MSNIVNLRPPKRHIPGMCDICSKPDFGAHQLVKDEAGQYLEDRVRCTRCSIAFGDEIRPEGHALGQCEPHMDADTRWLLLELLSDMVKLGSQNGDPEITRLRGRLGKIIERHQDPQGT